MDWIRLDPRVELQRVAEHNSWAGRTCVYILYSGHAMSPCLSVALGWHADSRLSARLPQYGRMGLACLSHADNPTNPLMLPQGCP